MNQRNYQRELDRILTEFQAEAKAPRLFLHSCCAPCSSYVLEYLSRYFEITVYYYNPNIFPEEEYEKRVEEQKRLILAMDFIHPVSFIADPYEPEAFYREVKGHETDPEGGERCLKCYELRLRAAAVMAAEKGYDYFTTTLT
ncbi:MAG: epoxyqueuosine reductase QueH, partial [Lachnospiraceae bacterium]|nr:epoxyqueuosine reductase QueH [Lachnospiraceae bacterium]